MIDFDDDPMPVFVLKAKDKLTFDVIAFYREMCHIEGLKEQEAEVVKAMNEIASWQARNRKKVKTPDHKHVPVGKESDGTGTKTVDL